MNAVHASAYKLGWDKPVPYCIVHPDVDLDEEAPPEPWTMTYKRHEVTCPDCLMFLDMEVERVNRRKKNKGGRA